VPVTLVGQCSYEWANGQCLASNVFRAPLSLKTVLSVYVEYIREYKTGVVLMNIRIPSINMEEAT